MPHPARGYLAFALDYPSLAAASQAAAAVAESVGVFKVGLELFVREGPPAARLGERLGAEVFLDLKLHDIPETVDRAVAAAAALGVRYLTVHAGGGRAMLEAAERRAEREATGLTLLAVTVLTSLDQADLLGVGIAGEPAHHAQRLAQLAWDAGVRGLVCSVSEVARLRSLLGPKAILVTPGIRPDNHGGSDDQKRTGTPRAAIADGASLLVVGRPIRDAADPGRAARAIADEISGVLPR